MDVVPAQSDIAQHPVIHRSEVRTTTTVVCPIDKVSRRTPAPCKRAVHTRRGRPRGTTCDAGRDIDVLVRSRCHRCLRMSRGVIGGLHVLTIAARSRSISTAMSRPVKSSRLAGGVHVGCYIDNLRAQRRSDIANARASRSGHRPGELQRLAPTSSIARRLRFRWQVHQRRTTHRRKSGSSRCSFRADGLWTDDCAIGHPSSAHALTCIRDAPVSVHVGRPVHTRQPHAVPSTRGHDAYTRRHASGSQIVVATQERRRDGGAYARQLRDRQTRTRRRGIGLAGAADAYCRTVRPHYHSEFTDAFVCLEGPVVVEIHVPRNNYVLGTRAALRRSAQDGAVRARRGN